MPRTIAHQLRLTPGFADHEHGRELATIDALLDRRPEIDDLVANDIGRTTASSPKGGRPGLTADQVLRAAILKQMKMLSYEELAFHLADSVSFQTFCRISPLWPTPSKATLQANIKRLRAETLEAVHRMLLEHAREAGIERGQTVRFDCTVTESNIHEPTDASLLWDVVRVLSRLMRQARKRFGTPFTNHTRVAKRRRVAIQHSATDHQRRRLYRDLVQTTEDTLKSARFVASALSHAAVTSLMDVAIAEGLRREIPRIVGLGERVVDQTRRRVFDGEKVPAAEKLVSIFEEHTDIIVKDRRDTLYGHKLCLASGVSNLILDSVVLDGNPADSTLACSMVKRQTEIYGSAPLQVAFDGGFTSKANLAEIKAAKVRDVAFSKRRGLAVADMVRQPWVYRRLRNFRAGIEGSISFLKRCFGLTRCMWRGFASFQAYVWVSVLAANLLVMARHLIAAQR